METPRWEDLGAGAGLWVTKESPLTTDALLLADFSAPKKGERCADLGTGCGSIAILWRRQSASGSILAVELQPEVAAMAADSVARNGFGDTLRVVCGDAARPRELFAPQSLDLVACNPPYYPEDRGAVGAGPRGVARHGGSLTLSALAASAGYGLKWGGRLCVCLPAERLAEAVRAFGEKGLEPKRLRMVQSRPEKPPYLLLMECRRGGKPGLALEPTLLIADASGKPSPALLAAYGPYRKEG